MFFKRFAFLAALLLCGCQEITTEFSEVLQEKATIVEASYAPAHTNLTLSCGLGFDGGLSCGPGLDNVPAKYRVIMRSERCTFTFFDEVSYREFQHSIDDSVYISYRESYRALYDDGQGDKRLVSRNFLGCEFVKFGSG